MMLSPILIPPAADFWMRAAQAILATQAREQLLPVAQQVHDLSALCVVVPTFYHGQYLKAALAQTLQCAFIPPRIITMTMWLSMMRPDPDAPAIASGSERLMSLYAGLRGHAWLKKLFSTRRNTDLLPLAQTLLTLSDELTQALLPTVQMAPDAAEACWQQALAELPPPALKLLADESQLVWTIWKSQLDTNDATAARFAQMMRLAAQAQSALVWISPVEPDALEAAFLAAYGERQPVLPIMLDWRAEAVDATCLSAWHELLAETDAPADSAPSRQVGITTPAGLSLCQAGSLEDEALRGAQTVVDWLQNGKSAIAIVAQDRVVARRMRALLERAQVFVADETGWKLSTTRAAAALAAWFELVSSRAETMALLDFLKSPFLFPELGDKSAQVMTIERALRRANVLGGWAAAANALSAAPAEQALLRQIAQQAGLFARSRSLSAWIETTCGILDALGMRAALQDDAAGQQVWTLLETLAEDCTGVAEPFSAAEWRAFVSLQLEETAFVAPNIDARVVMLPLNGARLRSFDAVLLVGADARHLPSQPGETLFFANAVRAELGLVTRESRQRQQLRDFTELLLANRQVVLSWQAHQNGEPNPLSPWVERLELTLARAGAGPLPRHQVTIPQQELHPLPQAMPAPAAAHIPPLKLSASGYNSFVACPYQFFATRMLQLSVLDELSDMPEKRDYGGWLHAILNTYHATLRDDGCAPAARAALLQHISQQTFDAELAKNAAALGFYARWQKVMPAYLDWANAREADGWQFVMGEQAFEKTLRWPGGEIVLNGRIDRIDENADGERAVLDYKTRNQMSLSAKLKEGEDHQLPFYGLLSDAPVGTAHYVALELSKDKTGDASAPRYADWQSALETEIVRNMRAITQGAGLPANGTESVCQYCEVRGLCRKGAW